jgi:hypothetical protein
MHDRPITLEDPDDPHVMKWDELAHGSRNPVEDLLELQGLRGGLGDLRQDAGDGSRIHGWKLTPKAATMAGCGADRRRPGERAR